MNYALLRQRGRRLIDYYRDRTYYSRLFRLAAPIALQQFIMASLNMVGVILIGQLGETAVAAAGLGNQIFFLLSLFLFGVTSGAAIFTAQLWGKQDVVAIRKVLGLSLVVSVTGAGLFGALVLLYPSGVIGIYSKDPEVVRLGSQYLLIFGWSFPFTAVSYSYAAVLRSTGDVRKPLVVSTFALVLNMVLSYALILGKLGMPALGIQGAALAALISLLVEFAGMLLITYRYPSAAAARLSEMLAFNWPFAIKVLERVFPVALNEILWSLGITTYNIIYARIGTEALAAVNIATTIDQMAFVIFIGVGHATSILVGNQIGAGDEEQAYRYSVRTLTLSAAAALVMGVLLLAASGPVLSLYKVSPTVVDYAQKVVTVIAFSIWLRVSNMIMFIGIFRAGGDTRVAFILDISTIWLVGVPLALLGAFVFHLPVYGVYILVLMDELTKWLISMRRFVSRKWINNLAKGM